MARRPLVFIVLSLALMVAGCREDAEPRAHQGDTLLSADQELIVGTPAEIYSRIALADAPQSYDKVIDRFPV